MGILSLKLTIGLLISVTILIVSAVCLGISLSVSFDAIRSMGKGNAVALVSGALAGLEQHFDFPVQQGLMLQRRAKADGWLPPTSPNSANDTLRMREFILSSCLMSEGRIDRYDFFYVDNSRLGAELVREYGAYEVDQAVGRANNVYYLPGTRRYYNATTAEDVTSRVVVRTTGILNFGAVGAFGRFNVLTNGNTTALWTDGHIIIVEDQLVPFFPALFPVFGAPNGPNVLGYLYTSIGVHSLTQFLLAAKATPNTVSIIYDQDLTVLSTSEHLNELDNGTYYPPPGYPRTQVQPKGCFLSSDRTVLKCFPSVFAETHPAIAAVTGDAEFLLGRVAPRARIITAKADGRSHKYFMAQGEIKKAIGGKDFFMLLAMPEEDVIGDIITGRNIAIGVTVAIFVVMVAISWAVVYLVLAPLSTVSQRMYAAAALADDETAAASRSSMAEIAELEDAYHAMNAELQRLKAFVPHSILYAHTAEDDEEEDDPIGGGVSGTTRSDSDVYTNHSNRSRRSNVSKRSSRQTGPAMTAASRVSSEGAAGGGLNTAMSVRKENVTALCLNLRGFNRHVSSMSSPQIVAAMGETVSVVLDAVLEFRGVLDGFHGDHFLATFNAVHACPSHPRRATCCALKLAQLCPSHGMRLPITAGVATGKAMIGNVGAANLKHFCVLGPCMTQATVLERMAAMYPEVASRAVLLHPRVAQEIGALVALHPLDLVTLPGMHRAGVLCAAVVEHEGNTQEEWLYVLEGRGGDAGGYVTHILEEIGLGNVGEAEGLLAKLQSSSSPMSTKMYEATLQRISGLLTEAKRLDKLQPDAPPASDMPNAPSTVEEVHTKPQPGSQFGPFAAARGLGRSS